MPGRATILRLAALFAATAGMLAAPLISQVPDTAGADAEAEPVEEPALSAFSPAASIAEAFLHLQVALGALNDRIPDVPAIDSAATEELGRLINELQDLFGNAPARPGADYVQSLDFAANAIMAIADEEDAGAINAAVARLQRDFRIKITTARATLGATGRPPDTIAVLVRARRNGQDVRDLTIRAAAALYPRSRPIYAFATPTNPGSQRQLVPGIYLIYAYDRNGRRLAAVNNEFDVGLEGQRSAAVTLALRP